MASGPSVFGLVLGAGLDAFDPDAAAECGTPGVRICLRGTQICTESDAAGQFVLGGLTAGMDAVITFELTGYQPTLRLAQVGSDPINLRGVRMLDVAVRGDVHRDTGVTRDETTGVVAAIPIAPGEGVGSFLLPEGVSVALMPGEHRPFYSRGTIEPSGLSSNELDPELSATRAGGWAVFLNVPQGAYSLRFERNGVPCAQTLPGGGLGLDAQGNVRIEVVSGFTTSSILALCL
jgi:hypothetical protein